jgi:hypothetical protein
MHPLHVHLPQGIASTEASPTCPPTAGNCFNRRISHMYTYHRELLQRKHLLRVHLRLGFASPSAYSMSTYRRELLQQKHLLHVHLPQGIASTKASPTCPPTTGNCFNRSISYMSTHRREMLQQKHLLHVHLQLGTASTEASPTCHLPLGMTEGSILKSLSRHRAANCFHYMST